MIRLTRILTPALASVLSLLVPALFEVGSVTAQQPTGGIGFRNETTLPIVVQGASLVNGMLRRGQLVAIQPGKLGWDTNVPKGLRYVVIYDGRQTSRILYQDRPITFDGPDAIFNVRPHPTQRDRVILQQ